MYIEDSESEIIDENNVLFDKETMRRYQCSGNNNNDSRGVCAGTLKRVRSSTSLSSVHKYMTILSRDIREMGRGKPTENNLNDAHSSSNDTSSNKPSSHIISRFRRPSSVDMCTERRKLLRGMTRPVSVNDFPAWVKRSLSDSEFRFSEEFESMDEIGRNEKHDVANLPENKEKNRYNNVLPYDYTRVRLSSADSASDYINANYIHGYKQPRAYIACQGPLSETAEDFWRMIWEQRSAIIIMITKLYERGREKCHQYWPSTDTIKYGAINVTHLSESSSPHWTERKFLLEQNGESRFLRHMQYITWPDHGVPKSPSDVLAFMQKVRTHQQDTDGPPVCHCSAGVGRSGTYICIDILLNKLQHEKCVDVYGVVCLMRTQRCNMVQTEEQYILIHHVILEYLSAKDSKNLYLQPSPTMFPV